MEKSIYVGMESIIVNILQDTKKAALGVDYLRGVVEG